ncbi:MAG: c-type cytochrome [Saprospiraceae bacterium]
MKTLVVFCCIAAFICLMVHCKTSAKPENVSTKTTDSLTADRSKYANQVLAQIKGSEQVTVDSVFKNLKVLGGFPAENLIIAMERWSEALGVSCDHCHVINEWHSDVKPAKNVARQMVNFGETVNAELRKLQGLKSEKPGVNCFTCHRGELKPARRPK